MKEQCKHLVEEENYNYCKLGYPIDSRCSDEDCEYYKEIK